MWGKNEILKTKSVRSVTRAKGKFQHNKLVMIMLSPIRWKCANIFVPMEIAISNQHVDLSEKSHWKGVSSHLVTQVGCSVQCNVYLTRWIQEMQKCHQIISWNIFEKISPSKYLCWIYIPGKLYFGGNPVILRRKALIFQPFSPQFNIIRLTGSSKSLKNF